MENLLGDLRGRGASGFNCKAESTDAASRAGVPILVTNWI